MLHPAHPQRSWTRRGVGRGLQHGDDDYEGSWGPMLARRSQEWAIPRCHTRRATASPGGCQQSPTSPTGTRPRTTCPITTDVGVPRRRLLDIVTRYQTTCDATGPWLSTNRRGGTCHKRATPIHWEFRSTEMTNLDFYQELCESINGTQRCGRSPVLSFAILSNALPTRRPKGRYGPLPGLSLESERRESNPRSQLGKLMFCL